MHYVHLEDKERVEKIIYHAHDQKTNFQIEHRIVRKDGAERIVLEEGSLKMDAQGNPIQMTGIVHDITEVKTAQEAVDKLSKVVELIDDLVVITDLTGKISYVNQAFCDHTGYKREEVLGKTPRIIKSDQYDDNFYKELWKTILAGDVYRETIINKKENGDLFYEKKTISPLRDEEENIK